MAQYYVSLYFDRKIGFSPADALELIEIAEENRSKSFGTPETGIPSLAASADPGDMAFSFDGVKQASDFAKKALGLEFILSARIGLYR